MPALMIGGINIPVAVNTWKEKPREIGGLATSYSGSTRMSRLATKRDVEFEMPPMSVADAKAWTSLITGQSHSITWDTNNHYTSKGTPPNTVAADWTIGLSALSAGLNGEVLAGIGFGQTWWNNLGYPSDGVWSVVLWRSTFSGTSVSIQGKAKEHWIVRSDGKVYRDGVQVSSTGVAGVYPNMGWLSYNSTNGGQLSLNSEANLLPVAVRANTTAYSLNDFVIGSANAAGAGAPYVYKCTTAGTSGGAPPVYGAGLGSTIADGSVTWTVWGTAQTRYYDLFIVHGLAPAQWGIDALANPYVHGAQPACIYRGDLIPECDTPAFGIALNARRMTGQVESSTIRGMSGGSVANLVKLRVTLTD